MSGSLFERVNGSIPRPFDKARAARTLESLAEKSFVPTAANVPLLKAAFGNSPYLARTALQEVVFLRALLERGAGISFADVCRDLEAVAAAANTADAMELLRIAKRRAALAIALADISEAWPLSAVTGALSRFADASVSASLRFLLRQAAVQTDLASRTAEELEAETGLIVLAMGKHGAGELNYSSDIDLVVFYDAERFPLRKRDDARGAAVDLVKGLVKLLSEVTSDGYVFRVDLRLRPDAGATQVAISTDAAEAYYEAMGQNWERAALIKARPCAGDREAAAQFLKSIEAFVWRRYLDYAAIEDIHSIKRQIHAHAGHGKIAVAGHNIKLGRGGIREIEFFVQTQQLILGGRDQNLRASSTLAALTALQKRGLVTRETADELAEAYAFLRMLEHRLQMIEDEQTHTIPSSEEGLAHIACFMGFDSVDEFTSAVRSRLETVQDHYTRLFEQAPALATPAGSLVFTGVEDDPETLQTLHTLGFSDAGHVAHAVRGWHHGRIRATRSVRARELLTKLVPGLLNALASAADPDSAFAQFDSLLSHLPAGVQLFSMLLANPALLQLLADICGAAPRFADRLGRSPRLLDAILDPGFLAERPHREGLDASLTAQLAQSGSYERKLDAVRRFASEQMFRVAVHVLEGTAPALTAGPAFTNIAEPVIQRLLPSVEEEFAETAGRIEGGAFAIIALGKLGGREMTASSDLDLVFVYDTAPGVDRSDGAKPLPVSTYYARLAQRLIAALTAHTAEGGLYDVDMRLRPTGNKGPVAVSLESFDRYHKSESWTWERMALTRARMLCGPPALSQQVEQIIRRTLTSGVDPDVLQRDVRAMRQTLAANFTPKSHWDLKFTPGGLVDIEFIAQYLQLRYARESPSILDVNTLAALEKLCDARALEKAAASALIEAARLQQTLLQVLRIAIDGAFDPSIASRGLKQLLARAAGGTDFDTLDAKLIAVQAGAQRVYGEMFSSGDPVTFTSGTVA
jgi:glutamate-ammonia-ligase adenylyltransferase